MTNFQDRNITQTTKNISNRVEVMFIVSIIYGGSKNWQNRIGKKNNHIHEIVQIQSQVAEITLINVTDI